MTGRLDPPQWYDAERRGIWADTLARLTDSGGVFRADPKLLDVYVCAYANHNQAAQLVAGSGVLTVRNGIPVENPAMAVQRKAAADLARASRALGLHRTPMQAALAESPMQGDGRRWCDEHARWECKHPRKNGEPCHGWYLIPGLGSCRMHAGMTADQARAKGQAALARVYRSEPMDIDPGGALLWEVGHSAAHVADLRAKVAELAEAEGPDGEPGSGLWFGVYRETWADGQLVERELRPGAHPILRAYDAERDHLVRTAAAAHTAGAQDQAVNVARALGAGVHAFLDAIFRDLRLEAWQWDLVPEVVPARLAEYDPDGSAAQLRGELPPGNGEAG